MIKLTYDYADTYKVFAKKSWRGMSLLFSWNIEYQYYSYCYIKDGVIVFKESYHDEDRPSKVGDGVLACELVQIDYSEKKLVRLEEEEMKETIIVENATVTFTPMAKIEKTKKIKWYGFFYDADNNLSDSYFFVSKKEARKMLKKFPLGTTVELYRKSIKLSIDLPIIEEEV